MSWMPDINAFAEECRARAPGRRDSWVERGRSDASWSQQRLSLRRRGPMLRAIASAAERESCRGRARRHRRRRLRAAASPFNCRSGRLAGANPSP